MSSCLNHSITQFVQYKQKNGYSFLTKTNRHKFQPQETNQQNFVPIAAKFKYRYNKSNNKFRYRSEMNADQTNNKVSHSTIHNLALNDTTQKFNEDKTTNKSFKEDQNRQQTQKQLGKNSTNRSMNCVNGYLLPVQKKFVPILNRKKINPIKLKELYMIRKRQDKMFDLIQKQQKISSKRHMNTQKKQSHTRNRSMTESATSKKIKNQSSVKDSRGLINRTQYNKQNQQLIGDLKLCQITRKRNMTNFSFMSLHDKVRESLQFMQMSNLKQNKSYELNMIQLR